MRKHSNIRIEAPGVNVAVVRETDNDWEFLLLKRSEQETYPGFWGFLTGRKQDDETVAQIASRELAEETNLVAKSLWATESILRFYEPEADAIWMLPVVVAVVGATEDIRLSDENSEYRWLTSDEAIQRASWRNIGQAVGEISLCLSGFPDPGWARIRP